MRGWLLCLAASIACAPASVGPAEPAAVAGAGATAAAAPGQRTAADLRVELPRRESERFQLDDDPSRPLLASVYSLPSTLIDPDEAAAMLAAVHAADPRRQLLVLADRAARQRLAPLAATVGLRMLPVDGAAYSPWPRDPFSFARAPGGAVRLIVRPNLQRGREADADLGPALVRLLPPDLDREWGGVRWAQADVPFHNGQLLLTGDAVWATMHSFEPRVLQLLATERVPVSSFGTAAGIDAYLAAVQRAADELGALSARPVRFVHPLPVEAAGPLDARRSLMRQIGGGAGYDLDSLVTLLPAPSGRPAALVADLGRGERLLAAAPVEEWAAFAAAYGLTGGPSVRATLQEVAAQPAGRDLAAFLDLVAAHLASEGFVVERLPLLLVPLSPSRDAAGSSQSQFLLGWNNVVVETRPDGVRAEGFSSLLATGDRLARQTFEAAGVRLDLLPPLRGSVVRNGGYRCASNHLRARAAAW